MNETSRIIRVQTQNCRYRFQILPNDTYQDLVNLISNKIGLQPTKIQMLTTTGKQLNIAPHRKIKDVVYLSHGSILEVRIKTELKKSADNKKQTVISNNPDLKTISSPNSKNQQKSNNIPSNKQPQVPIIDNNPLTPKNTKKHKVPSIYIQSRQIFSPPQSKISFGSNKSPKNSNYRSRNNPELVSPPCKHNSAFTCYKCAKEAQKISKIVLETPKKIIQHEKQQESKITSPGKCNHGSKAKCLNCIDPNKLKEQESPTKVCQHSEYTNCVNCKSEQQPQKAAHISFDKLLSDRKHRCSHSQQKKCINCLPPENLRLKIDTNCKYHTPFPVGLCEHCKPQNISIKRQEYRHVDYVQFMNQHQIQDFINMWLNNLNKKVMRVAYLYGYYAQDPFYPKGIRAIVQALYEPHQKCTQDDFTIIDSQKRQQQLGLIIDSLGLEKIGIMITSITSETPLSEKQVRFISKMQAELSVSHQTGYKLSNFFTVVIRDKNSQSTDKQIEPEVFMVSDQGQALASAELFIPNKNPSKIKIRDEQKGNTFPTIYIQGQSTKQFEIQYLLVNIAAGMAKNNKFAILKSNIFPASSRGHISKQQMKQYLKTSERKNSVVRFGDLNLLLWIAEALDIDTAMEIAMNVKDQEQTDGSLGIIVDRNLQRFF